MATNGSPMSKELDSRLDELFEDEASMGSEKKGGALENLQALILEMEWEIEDKNLDAYLLELKKLTNLFKQDKALLIYIKLLDTIGRYLKARKAAAHPETVTFLKSMFDNFEKIASSDMPEAEKNRSTALQVNEFKRFKAAISSHAPSASKPAERAQAPEGNDVGLSEEIKTYIRQVVREEIVRLVKRK